MTDDVFHIIPGTKFKLTGRFHLDESEYARRRWTKYICVHCTDTPPSMHVDMAIVRKWHTEERGWSDSGYHFLVDRAGNWERGRPTWAVGAGAAGYNDRAIHLVLVGGRAQGSKKAEANFTQEQYESLELLIHTLKDGLNGDYASAQVIGHRDLQPGKECPSYDAKAWWLEREAALKHTLVG